MPGGRGEGERAETPVKYCPQYYFLFIWPKKQKINLCPGAEGNRSMQDFSSVIKNSLIQEESVSNCKPSMWDDAVHSYSEVNPSVLKEAYSQLSVPRIATLTHSLIGYLAIPKSKVRIRCFIGQVQMVVWYNTDVPPLHPHLQLK